MKLFKKMLVPVFALAMLIGTLTTVFAEPSPTIRDLGTSVMVETTNFVYDGSFHTTKVTVTDIESGVTLKQGTDYIIDRGARHANASDYHVFLKGIGQYKGEYVALWRIYRRTIQGATIIGKDKVYNGKSQKSELTVIVNGRSLVEGKDYVFSKGTSSKIVGRKSVTIRGIGNYTGSTGGYWRITKCPLSKIKENIKLEVRKTAAGYSYPKFISAKGLAGEKVICFVPSPKEIKTKKKGTYTVTVTTTSTGSYYGSVDLTWVVK